MASKKRLKWAKNKDLERVLEPDMRALVEGDTFLRGEWHRRVFENDRPITLELGCGKGAYTVALARRYPERNVIGVDVKGHRFWTGAQVAHDEGLGNAAFLRARVEFLDRCFGQNEVDEIWLTFSDPRPKDERGTKRITSPLYHGLFQSFVRPGGLVHVKSDSPLLYDLTLEGLRAEGYDVEEASRDVHGELVQRVDPDLAELLGVVTDYEARWIAEGRSIHYLRTRLPNPARPAQIDRALDLLQGTRRRLPTFAGEAR